MKRSQISRIILIIFLSGGAIVAALASFTMLVTGTVVDNIWKQKETEYHQMLHHRIPIGLGFALLAILLALAVSGLYQRRRSGWLLSIIIFGVNFVADLVTLITSKSLADSIPVVIEILILIWLVLPRTKRMLIK